MASSLLIFRIIPFSFALRVGDNQVTDVAYIVAACSCSVQKTRAARVYVPPKGATGSARRQYCRCRPIAFSVNEQSSFHHAAAVRCNSDRVQSATASTPLHLAPEGADGHGAAPCLRARARRRDPEAPVRLPPTCEVRGDSGARPPHSARPLPSPAVGAQGVLCEAARAARCGCAEGHGAGPIRTSGRGQLQPKGVARGHLQGAPCEEASCNRGRLSPLSSGCRNGRRATKEEAPGVAQLDASGAGSSSGIPRAGVGQTAVRVDDSWLSDMMRAGRADHGMRGEGEAQPSPSMSHLHGVSTG